MQTIRSIAVLRSACVACLVWIGIVAGVLAARPAYAQTQRAPGWLAELNALQSPKSPESPEARRARVAAIRVQIEQWLALNPSAAVNLPTAPEQPWSDAEVGRQIGVLKQVVQTLLEKDANQPFYLGSVVTVTAPDAILSPVTDTMDRREIQKHQALTVNQAIEYLPGVAVDHKAPRNQTGISIGGFDSRQVPLYVDGIPAYLPFDGYVDLTRYLTSGVAEVQVAKGYSSALLGPNLLGGVINVVTRQPQKKLEGEVFFGGGGGSQANGGLRVGSRWHQGFLEASADRLQSHAYPIAGSFAPTPTQTGDQRVNSDQRDGRYQVRAGWTPRGQDSYVISYANQQGQSGVPPYSGSAPPCAPGNVTSPCVTPKFWRWPQWDANGYSFNSHTAIGRASSADLRAFSVDFANSLAMFDDATHSSQKANSSGNLDNHDQSLGVSGTFQTRAVPRHVLGASFFVKQDIHREQTTTFSATHVATTTPELTDRDRQSSVGVEDIIRLSADLRATIGISADQLHGLQAQDLNSSKTAVVPFQVPGLCSASSSTDFQSCTSRVWTYNPVASLSYTTPAIGAAYVTFAEKSRFPSIKDRYSYKAGKAVPNPMLRPERARTWTAGYSRVLPAATVVQVEVFRSRVRDEIENVSFLSPLCASGKAGAGVCQQAVNVGEERHQGVNVTLRTSPVPWLTVDANYGFLHREISGTPGVFPTGTPRHKAVGTVTFRLPKNATALISARHQFGAVAMSDNGLPLPPSDFTSVDLSGIVPLRAGASVQGGVQNLLDRNYFYWEGFPEAGRHWYVTLRWGF